jgi:hypothetical protein
MILATLPIPCQPNPDPAIQEIRNGIVSDTRAVIESFEQKVAPSWERKAEIYFYVSACVFLLGLLTTALERLWNSPKAGLTIACFGVAVAGMTWWQNNGFGGNHKSYRKSASSCRRTISQLNLKLNVMTSRNFASLDEVLQYKSQDLDPLLGKLEALESELLASADLPFQVQTAYAAQELVSLGTGDCNLLGQSETNATALAISRLAEQLSPKSGGAFSPGEKQALREYVERYAAKSQSKDALFRTTLTLHPTYARAAPIYAQKIKPVAQGKTVEDKLTGIKAAIQSPSFALERTGYLERDLGVPLKGGFVTWKADNPKDGWFDFDFQVSGIANQRVQLRMRSIVIREDASGGSTRWAFYVMQQGKLVFEIPEQRWDDGKKPTVCRIDPQSGWAGEAAIIGNTIPIRIVGVKPKVDTAKY